MLRFSYHKKVRLWTYNDDTDQKGNIAGVELMCSLFWSFLNKIDRLFVRKKKYCIKHFLCADHTFLYGLTVISYYLLKEKYFSKENKSVTDIWHWVSSCLLSLVTFDYCMGVGVLDHFNRFKFVNNNI